MSPSTSYYIDFLGKLSLNWPPSTRPFPILDILWFNLAPFKLCWQHKMARQSQLDRLASSLSHVLLWNTAKSVLFLQASATMWTFLHYHNSFAWIVALHGFYINTFHFHSTLSSQDIYSSKYFICILSDFSTLFCCLTVKNCFNHCVLPDFPKAYWFMPFINQYAYSQIVRELLHVSAQRPIYSQNCVSSSDRSSVSN